MILVDTNVWSELIRAEPDQKVVNWEAANGHLLWISTIVLAEFRARAFLMADGKRKEQVSFAIEAIASQYSDRILDFDEPCSAQYGAVLLSARETGFPIDSADAMIAATARAKGMTLATRNTNDFSGTGVALINPWES